MTTTLNIQILDLAKKMLSGEISRAEALKELNRFSHIQPGELADAVHFLFHFADDSDIRARDDAYAKTQMDRLIKLIGTLSL